MRHNAEVHTNGKHANIRFVCAIKNCFQTHDLIVLRETVWEPIILATTVSVLLVKIQQTYHTITRWPLQIPPRYLQQSSEQFPQVLQFTVYGERFNDPAV